MVTQLTDKGRLRFYSSVFSRSFFSLLLDRRALSASFMKRLEEYDPRVYSSHQTLGRYLQTMYDRLLRSYRNEYIYKNTLLQDIIKRHARQDTVVFNEFKCGDSFADLAMFNGDSRVYEIKTELDNPVRLKRQLHNYKVFFHKCYIVTHASLVDKYSKIDDEVGIIALSGKNMHIEREAVQMSHIDVDVLMQSLHTNEYKSLVQSIYGELPNVGSFKMYAACRDILKNADESAIYETSVEIVKRRGRGSKILWEYYRHWKLLLQICLSLHVSQNEYRNLCSILNRPISAHL